MLYSTNKHDEIEFSLFLVFPSYCFIYKLYCTNSCVENNSIYSQYKDFEETVMLSLGNKIALIVGTTKIPTLGGKSFATRRLGGSRHKTKALL